MPGMMVQGAGGQATVQYSGQPTGPGGSRLVGFPGTAPSTVTSQGPRPTFPAYGNTPQPQQEEPKKPALIATTGSSSKIILDPPSLLMGTPPSLSRRSPRSLLSLLQLGQARRSSSTHLPCLWEHPPASAGGAQEACSHCYNWVKLEDHPRPTFPAYGNTPQPQQEEPKKPALIATT